MVWIKRNLFFVLSAAVGLILMAGAGYFFYTNWDADRAAVEELKQAQSDLENLQKKNLTKEAVQSVKDSQVEVQALLDKFKTVFATAPAIPDLDEKTFKSVLDKTLAQLQLAATNYAVALPASDYSFSFSGLTTKLNFPTNCISGWLVQLSEIKSICDIVFTAKVNTLESIRRCPISADESGAAGEFLPIGSVTNETLIRTPYELVVRGYSREIADLLNGLMRSTNCYIIKNIDIGPASGSTSISAGSTATTGTSADVYARLQRRERRMSPTAALEAAPANPQAPTTMVSEGLTRTVILLEIVKPKAP